MRPMKNKPDNIYQQILSVGEELIQTKGYNAFSYRDISEIIGIKTSSIHYYFPSKSDLGEAVVKHHVELLCNELEQLKNNNKLSERKKLKLFFESIFAKTYLSDRKMCLGGMLASDVLTLPENIQAEVRIFFSRIESWLQELFIEGLAQDEFCIEKKEIKQEVRHILSMLEGGLLLARLYREEHRLTEICKFIMDRVTQD